MVDKLSELFKELDEAVKNNNITGLLRINSEIEKHLGGVVTESSLDYDFIESIKEKTVYKKLCKVIKEGCEDRHDLMKLLSSLTTHLIIECDLKEKDLKEYPIRMYTNLINRILESEEGISDAVNFLRERYNKFI